MQYTRSSFCSIIDSPAPVATALICGERRTAASERGQSFLGMPEAHVLRLWLRHAQPGVVVRTDEGQELRIVDSGTVNTYDGPDIRAAQFELHGTVLRGDIEIHVREGDWQRHGHAHDRRYDGVRIHVVLVRERGAYPRSDMYTVVLPDILGKRLRAAWAEVLQDTEHYFPCAAGAAHLSVERRDAALILAASERFHRKCDNVRERLKSVDDSNGIEALSRILYDMLARALGYGGNEHQMELAARRLPLSMFDAHEPVGKDTARRMIEFVLQNSSVGVVTPGILSGRDPVVGWNRRGIRPGNTNLARLQQLVTLASSLRRHDAVPMLCDALRRSKSETATVLHRFFINTTMQEVSPPGPSRIQEMLVNVIAPVFAVFASTVRDAILLRASTALYFSSTGAQPNRKTRALGFLVDPDTVSQSTVQQGLIELHDTLCARLACSVCVVNQPHIAL